VRDIITQARKHAVRAINIERVFVYWHIPAILKESKYGAHYAAYASSFIKGLVTELQPQFGSFSERQLERYC
jgi:hypothetical protein